MTNKICSKCGKQKPLDEFFVKDSRTGRLHAQCKDCYRQRRQSYYLDHYQRYRDEYLARATERRKRLRLEFRTKMLAYLTDKCCALCGETDVRVFEFDHIDPEQKDFNISQAVRIGRNWDDVLAEIQKCRILCANCHKRHTAAQYGWYKA